MAPDDSFLEPVAASEVGDEVGEGVAEYDDDTMDSICAGAPSCQVH